MKDNRTEAIQNYLGGVSDIVTNLPPDVISDIIQTIKDAHTEGRQVLICGNGGSAATASHFACDLQKGIGCLTARKFRAIAFTDSMPIVTAWANDTDYANIFAEQVATWANPGDVLIAISGSGNSPNVVEAVELANKLGVTTVGLSGMGGGKLGKIAQKSLVVPSDNMQQIEDVHVVLAHLMFSCLCQEIGTCE
ncbi:MAG: SIS domain-containing protein [Armatimonadetes bacterium]|nr:SIS domain-containing protein [Armatimonadota bacterium]